MQEKPSTAALKHSVFAVWRWTWWVWTVVVPLMIPVGYYAAYLLMLQGPSYIPVYDYDSGKVREASVPYYRFNDGLPLRWSVKLAEVLEPAHRVDRRLRPRYWGSRH